MLKLRTGMSTRRRGTLATVATAAAVATLLSATPSALAADPTTPIDLRDGETRLTGTLHWHQRSLGVDYSLTTRSCTRLLVSAVDANGGEYGPVSTPSMCADRSGSFTVSVNTPGGAASAVICLVGTSGTSGVCGRYNRP
ncbi:hypothetical protein [Amycolatopsis sp. DG1A-15b]|uniref:hypothetical protein n=1 Tax=Amycolatopsis sp. DG1A-15b TaxID=3052846 RepID=UPI00255B99E6|nr:hypothetical protein [Amycolatopsis sp. DG1A-15b]WIX92458.1 hypothetical protein QRY02_19270 [Amycolatopsis sp. DG1A-15b]